MNDRYDCDMIPSHVAGDVINELTLIIKNLCEKNNLSKSIIIQDFINIILMENKEIKE
jgi:hypothetical protein